MTNLAQIDTEIKNDSQDVDLQIMEQHGQVGGWGEDQSQWTQEQRDWYQQAQQWGGYYDSDGNWVPLQ